LHRLERVGRRAGRPRAPSETVREYATAVAHAVGDVRVVALGETLDEAMYSGRDASEQARAATDAVLTSL
jgi:hypothetical protein